ncbi:MAG: hypothetical protein ACPGU5_01660 [Lishizhenia sp.]
MKFTLSPLISDIFILVYISVTLFLRFKLENQVNLSTGTSVIIGFLFVFILYIMIKSRVLNPNWFGLFKSKK